MLETRFVRSRWRRAPYACPRERPPHWAAGPHFVTLIPNVEEWHHEWAPRMALHRRPGGSGAAGASGAFDAEDLLQSVDCLDEVALILHDLVDRLVGARDLVEHGRVL